MVLFTACKKSEDENNTEAGKILKAGKWQLSAYIATVNYMGTDTTIDLWKETKECEKDDIITFSDNRKGTQDEGATICPGGSQQGTFEWELLNNDTRIALIDNNPDTADVLELNTAQLRFRLIGYNSSGDQINYVRTYKNIQ